MSKKQIVIFILTALMSFASISSGEQHIVSKKVNSEPVIDGKAENMWDNAKSIITHDNIANIDVTLKSVHTGKKIFFMAAFPDKDESRTHKSWVWNKTTEIYEIGNDREDVFLFKWNMEPAPVDLSIYSDNIYKADVWYWKACRTDPLGYADDKIDILSTMENRNAVKLESKSKRIMYLLRNEDKGDAAFRTNLVVTYKGDVVTRFILQEPTESRKDIKAKGTWNNGIWTIEFSRAIMTGNEDDVQFSLQPGRKFQFGISRYEIGGLKPDPKLSQPLFGCGDVSENLFLVFEQ
ncbi:MAG: ethylbenzene dehydrogenase-related protein [bacterium]